MSEPTSQKPYLLRAIYEWCVDNGFTPYIAVVVDDATRVPVEYVRNGEIVLNIGPLAANKLKMGNDTVEFAARFGGVARELSVPVHAIAAIYARETGQGLPFEVERKPRQPAETGGAVIPVGPMPVRSHDEPRAPDIAAPPAVRPAPAPAPAAGSAPEGDGPKPPHGPRPSLRRIK